MEYCGGGSLEELIELRGNGLEEEQIAYICAECLKVGSFIHSFITLIHHSSLSFNPIVGLLQNRD
jgi:serine/threonine protein kinase